MSKRDTLKIPS